LDSRIQEHRSDAIPVSHPVFPLYAASKTSDELAEMIRRYAAYIVTKIERPVVTDEIISVGDVVKVEKFGRFHAPSALGIVDKIKNSWRRGYEDELEYQVKLNPSTFDAQYRDKYAGTTEFSDYGLKRIHIQKVTDVGLIAQYFDVADFNFINYSMQRYVREPIHKVENVILNMEEYADKITDITVDDWNASEVVQVATAIIDKIEVVPAKTFGHAVLGLIVERIDKTGSLVNFFKTEDFKIPYLNLVKELNIAVREEYGKP